MGAPLLKPRKANGTRWVQHRLMTTRALLSSYPVLVAHLESMAVDPTHDRAKAKGLLNLITSFKFIVHVLLFQEILAPLARLSLAWQRDAVEMPQMIAAEKCLKDALERLSVVDAENPSSVDKLMNESHSADVSYKEVKLSQAAKGAAFFTRHRASYVENVKECCEDRFCLEDTTKIFNCVTVLDTNLRPKDHDELLEHGDAKIRMAASHFAQVIGPDVDTNALVREWHELKVFGAANMKGQPPEHIWMKVHVFYADRYPCVARIIHIPRVLPFSNALVERCFSTMNKIKTDWRASLDTATLDMLIRIKKTGPQIDAFKSAKSVDVFFTRKPRRPTVQPYGKRPMPDKEVAEADADAAGPPPAKC